MRNLRNLGLGLTIVMLVAACGGNAGKSQEPGSSNAASSGPSSAPSSAASVEPSSGGGGQTNFDDGKATFELTGAATRSGEFGYLKDLGTIDPAGNQIALTFTNFENGASLTINSGPSGSVVLYADEEIGATLLPINNVFGECTVDIDTLETDHARGTFRCEHIAIINSTESSIVGEGTLSGSFDAQD